MKKLKEKDLELNPDVVTNLTGSGTPSEKMVTDSVNPVCTALNECGTGDDFSCACASENCTDGCYETLKQTCNDSKVCIQTNSNGIQCCDKTMGDTCTASNNICPATFACETVNGCESTTIACDISDGCTPVYPAETVGC